MLAIIFNILLISRYQQVRSHQLATHYNRVLRDAPFPSHPSPTPHQFDQRGFTKTDGCLANSLILDTIVNDRTQARLGTSMITMDLRKAFDSVSHFSILRALRRVQMPPYLIEYVTATLTSSSTVFHVVRRLQSLFPSIGGSGK